MRIPQESPVLSPEEQDIIRVLLYFDIFSYPLNASEILEFSNSENWTEELMQSLLDGLVSKNIIHQSRSFYSIEPNPKLVQRRIDGNYLAESTLPLAHKMSRLIAKFPYVKGIFISGSLSKNFMTLDADIDFFLVTQPGRLWICRTLLILYKKIFLKNSHKLFCLNYFVDCNHLEIKNQNLFTATEVATVLPVYGNHLYDKFNQANKWIYSWFPRISKRKPIPGPEFSKGGIRRFIEFCLNNLLGDKLDDFLMKFTRNHWKKKFPEMPEDQFEIAFRSTKHVSKHHPMNFQKKIMEKYTRKLRKFSQKHDLIVERVNG